MFRVKQISSQTSTVSGMATHKPLEIESALKKNEVRYNLRWSRCAYGGMVALIRNRPNNFRLISHLL